MGPLKCIAILYGGWIYANDHIYLSMNVNGNFGNKRTIILRQSTTDAIFVICQLQEKFLTVGKQINMAFMDLEKSSDQVP